MSTRAALRELSAERRKEIQRAVREGRAVSDRRDAALAVQVAERVTKAGARWPLSVWVRPTTPWQRFWRLTHAVSIAFSFVVAGGLIWRTYHYGKWFIIAWIVWMLTSIPSVISVYRLYANAPRALEANRRVL